MDFDFSFSSLSDSDLLNAAINGEYQYNDRESWIFASKEAEDALRDRLKTMRSYCEAADAIIFDPDGVPVIAHDFMPARRSYRSMRDRHSVTTDTQPGNTAVIIIR